MLEQIRELARDSLFRPRVAARKLLKADLSAASLREAALLLACLSTISKALLLRYLLEFQTETSYQVTGSPIADAAVQFGSIYLAVYAVKVIGRCQFQDSMVIYVWFNLLFFTMSIFLMGLAVLLPALSIAFTLLMLGWAIWAVGKFWAELTRSGSAIAGFFVALSAMLVSSVLTVLIAETFGLPMLEIV